MLILRFVYACTSLRRLHLTPSFSLSLSPRLGQFQGDLGNISSEIKHLQDKSMSMSIQLQNRKNAEERLSVFVQSIIISPDLVT